MFVANQMIKMLKKMHDFIYKEKSIFTGEVHYVKVEVRITKNE